MTSQDQSWSDFITLAGAQHYDCAHTYDTERCEWVALNPMTADLWRFWQAARSAAATGMPTGWVAVPVEPTEAMLNAVHESAYVTRALAWREAETARYAALLAAAPKLPQGDGWLPIESAPRDGSWLALWRPPESEGSIMRSEPLIIARWSDEYGEFAWPDSPCDRFTPWGRAIADAIVEDGRRIFATNDFTHWMQLPQPPKES